MFEVIVTMVASMVVTFVFYLIYLAFVGHDYSRLSDEQMRRQCRAFLAGIR